MNGRVPTVEEIDALVERLQWLRKVLREIRRVLITYRHAPPEPEQFRTDVSVDELDFSVRVTNILDCAHVRTVAELAAKTAKELLRYRNFGPTCLREVQRKLADRGLKLRETFAEDE